MKKQEIEFKVLDIIDRLEHGQPIEDNEVELKARWPEDHFRAARRIAAHANSAGGANIMWLIGVDEKKGVIGARFEELSTWYAKVTSKFDQLIAPTLISLSVPYKGKTVAALVFETDRAPYVIRIPNSHTGPVTHEVPWREANSTRSARRSDLIKMLYTVNRKPEIEVLNGSIELQKTITSERSGQCRFQWALSMQVYFASHTSETIVFPFHKCNIVFRQRGNADEKNFENIKITPPTSFSSREFKEKSQSLTVNATAPQDNNSSSNASGEPSNTTHVEKDTNTTPANASGNPTNNVPIIINNNTKKKNQKTFQIDCLENGAQL